MSIFAADQNPWIRQSRSALTKGALSLQPWTIEWFLDHIVGDLQLMHDIRDRYVAKNYYEFIINGRTPGKTFDIPGVVANALSRLRGDPLYD